MKTIAALALAAILSIPQSIAQKTDKYYVTIGVFSKVYNAKRLTDKANGQNFNARYELEPSRNLNYVYVLATSNKREAFALSVKLRVESEYKDAWVFIGKLGESTEPPAVVEKVEPVVEVKPTETVPVPVPAPVIIDSVQKVKPAEPVIEVPPPAKKPSGKPFYIKLVNAADGSEIKSGEVHIQEGVKATQYQAFKPGEIIYLEAPKNSRGAFAIVTQVPGYSPISLMFNYQNPVAEKGSQDELIIEIPMKKAKKGDYVDFNNVKFLKNASILQPAAQNELDGLVDLMKENPKYKIKVYGFVNGKQERETFTRGPGSGFFKTDPSVDKTNKQMSAKALSEERAETIRQYLISQGIDASRISIKGEGGKVPLYPEGGSLGPLNDRVEIEFTKN